MKNITMYDQELSVPGRRIMFPDYYENKTAVFPDMAGDTAVLFS